VTINPGRHSEPTLLVVGRRIAAGRDGLVESWSQWIVDRESGGRSLDPGELKRTLRLIVDLLPLMTGPMRREARETWFAATELYGRLAEARGLSAGEVVEEFQHLRELLIVELGDLIVALPARQQLPAVLRANRVCDHGVANAVVGYTDALVAKLFSKDGVPVPTADDVQELLGQLHGLEEDVRQLGERSAG
jgi:hypothetical protein